MKYIKKLIRNSKRALNQQVIKKKQEIVKYAPRLTGIQAISFRPFLPIVTHFPLYIVAEQNDAVQFIDNPGRIQRIFLSLF